VLQNPVTMVLIAAVLVMFALSMFDVWEFRLPGFITGAASKNYAGYFGSLFMGLTLGMVAAPCIGPFVVGLLVWVASTGNPLLGFLVFFSLSLGMGLPLFVLALLSGRLRHLPRSGEWMLWVRKLMGWVLIGMAAYFLKSLILDPWGNIPLSLVALAAGIHLGWVDSSRAGFRAFAWIKKGGGVCAIAIALSFLWPVVMQGGEGIKWLPYSENMLSEAKKSGKPIIVDFSADWCVPCRKMELATFRDRSVVQEAETYFVTIRVDLTRSGNREKEEMARRHNVRGVPTVLFLKPGGEEIENLRIQEFVNGKRFLARMQEVRRISTASVGR